MLRPTSTIRNHDPMAVILPRVRLACAVLPVLCWAGAVLGADVPPAAMQRLRAGEAVDLIVEYEASAVAAEAASRRLSAPRRVDDAAILGFRAERYAALRSQADAAADPVEVVRLVDYTHLPMAARRFRSAAAAQAYARQPGVRAVYEDTRLHAITAQSLPLIGQPAVAAAGLGGAGGGTATTVVVIDNGIKLANFGCTAAATPASCRVVVAQTAGTATGGDGAHGSNVAGVALAVAPGAHVAALDAFSGTSASTSNVLAGISWAIDPAHRDAYNIVAINLSLGDGVNYTAPCAGSAFATPVANAQAAGISVVAASGNEGRTGGMASPACTPGIVSVGAVYDANVGTKAFSACTDATTAADKVACFSNSASFLTLLAPGSVITAGGYIASGTSQASPHVAGAVAVLRAAFPVESLAQTLARMTSTGAAITDPRNGIVKPRLNLLDAARPANDPFAGAVLLSGPSGSASGSSLLATPEAGEPQHAGNPGGHSVWWRWTAPAAGQVSLDTHGSDFDTLLGVYVGSAVGALQPVAANDNDSGLADGSSGLLFQAQAGTEYRIAADGANGEAGSLALAWNLNAAAQSNLSLGMVASSSGPDASSHVLTVGNAGPQAATGVRVTLNLPSGASYVSGPAECVAGGSAVTCSVGTLASGASTMLTLQLAWSTGGAPASVSASVASDLPDPVASDNTQVVEVAFGASIDGDVPTLPEWGTLLLAMLLAGMAAFGQARATTIP